MDSRSDYSSLNLRWNWPQKTWLAARLQAVRAEKYNRSSAQTANSLKPVSANSSQAADKAKKTE